MLLDSPTVAVGDYAASIGTTGSDDILVFPSPIPPVPPNGAFQGVLGVSFGEICDGLTHTLLIGEKHVPRGFETLWPWDCGLYDGHNPVCSTRAAGPGFPLAVTASDPNLLFGSRHPRICQFVFGDGRVQALKTTINPVLLGRLAQRNDGQAVSDY